MARSLLVDDEPVSSAYVAYRGTMPVAQFDDQAADRRVDLSEVVVYVGPGCHFVHYGLRGGELLNQVAVFESPKALAGEEDWGTPDELDAAFADTCDAVRAGIPHMWRDKWWRMYDRDPITTWVHGRIALLGDAAHPPLQYMAQGAIMAIEDGWVLAEHVAPTAGGGRARRRGRLDRGAGAYEAVRPEHCRRVVTTARAWGELWHLAGTPRDQRNALLRRGRPTTTPTSTGSTVRPPSCPRTSRRCTRSSRWRPRRTRRQPLARTWQLLRWGNLCHRRFCSARWLS